MNTADRSVALVDAALRRRFRFIDFPPDYGVARSRFGFDTEYDVTSAARGERSDLEQLQALSIQAVEQLNETIIELPDLGKGKQIGHSYLLVDPDDEQALVDAWRYEILPLLEEYFYGQLSRIRQELFNQNGDSLVDWEREQIKDFDPETLRESLQAIVNAG
jgi:5-methylcytosine-specific restriction protein B